MVGVPVFPVANSGSCHSREAGVQLAPRLKTVGVVVGVGVPSNMWWPIVYGGSPDLSVSYKL